MSDAGEPRALVEIVSRHADDAAFLWILRNSATTRPHHSIASLTTLDLRLAAALDALDIAGGTGRAILEQSAVGGDQGEVFACAVTALQSEDEGQMEALIELAVADPLLARPIVSALGWEPLDRMRPHIRTLLEDASPIRRHIGLAAAAIHRSDPGPAVQRGTLEDHEPLRARALRAVGELGRVDLLPSTAGSLRADDPELRFSAAWSTAVLSPDPEALSALASIAQSDSRHRERALQTAMRRADPGAAKVWLRRLAQDSGTLRLAVQGAGAIGDPGEIPWLIEHMKVPELARVAGESFTTITGVDLAHEDLETDRPEGFESGPTEDPADENVELDPDENLPWPDPRLIEKWWLSNRHAFQSGTRHLSGKPITVDWCKQVLRIGRQRQRAAAALELSMRQPGTPLFEVRAPGFRQKQLLGL